ncbi:cupin domain-containing protein [Rufibacter sp. LB8]|uniref:cupin domain-containing protein n=1 Tax=Rufibacter sp. LB8 TaxID=2777781 RepID=UPI00178C4C47|nr:cupin domain-containing protein [Rufibacter sp. LB8]
MENLTDHVPYTPEKFNSKILLNQDGQKTILFAFAQGQGLKTHTTPNQAVLVVLEGTAHFMMEDQTHDLTSGTAIYIPANVPHALTAVTDFKMLLVKP